MPRRSSGGRPAPRRAPAPAPRASAPAPAVQSSSPGILGGIGSTIAQGMAFGGGSAVAHRAVDSIMGPRTIQTEAVAAATAAPTMGGASGSDACSLHSRAFNDCISANGSEISKCQFYLDMLSECRKNSTMSV